MRSHPLPGALPPRIVGWPPVSHTKFCLTAKPHTHLPGATFSFGLRPNNTHMSSLAEDFGQHPEAKTGNSAPQLNTGRR
ncbi:hypothetical protein BS47DRAFT_1344815 [Hydnum rufescens UP504]|uniref:Uncharacterized protein n=1 Tax=Hydnum rufescens UP504 TaxID=1448309 RepID=A0A9P6AVV6_9AGAM|nr:hypothetical protein BS47DRAFT_1344815 [Hydnum rufescens UP504]